MGLRNAGCESRVRNSNTQGWYRRERTRRERAAQGGLGPEKVERRRVGELDRWSLVTGPPADYK